MQSRIPEIDAEIDAEIAVTELAALALRPEARPKNVAAQHAQLRNHWSSTEACRHSRGHPNYFGIRIDFPENG